MRIRTVTLIAAREVRESVRNRWFLLASAAFFALSLALSLLGLAGAERSGLAGFDRTTASVLNLALLFIPLLTLIVGGLGVAGELEDGWLGLLLAQPVERSEVYFGKYLGLLASVSASVLLGFGGTGLAIGMTVGGDARAFGGLIFLVLMLAAATLAIGTFISAGFRTRSRVIGAAFGAWLLLVYLSDLGTMGLAIARNLEPAQVFALALLNPVQEARLLGVLALSQRLDVLGPVGIYGMDHFGLWGLVTVMAGGLCAITGLALGAGYLVFRKAIIP